MAQKKGQDKRISLAKERTNLADERTDWALQRTVLANERTFSAWVRTGVAATAAGLGIQKLLGSTSSPWLARTVGAIFIFAGAVSYVVALWRYVNLDRAMKEEGMLVTPVWIFGLVTLALLASAALAFLLLWHPSQFLFQ